MLLKLMLKDLKVHYRTLMAIFIGYMLAGGFFVFRFYSWHVYAMYGYLTVAFAGSVYFFTEKKGDSEIFSCSLPVTRTALVTARYINTVIIVLAGMLLWIGNALIFSRIYPDGATDANQLFYSKVLLMALLFFTVFFSIFLPGVFRLQFTGTVFALISALILAILIIPTFFAPYRHTYNPYFSLNDSLLVLVLLIFIIIAPILSYRITIIFFKKRNL